MPRDPTPPTAPILPDLRTEDGEGPIEAVVDVVGYVGEADDPEEFVRMHPERDYQAFMDFSVDVEVFSENAESVLERELVTARMSVWNFLPATRYFAAVLMGLIREHEGRY